MPNGTKLTISIGPGTPSAEGPRTTTTRLDPHRHHVLRARRSPARRADTARAAGPDPSFAITFNNTLDPKAFDRAAVKIEPALAASIGVAGNILTINGATKSNTKYVVELPASLRDEFGQTLGAAQAKTFDVGEATPALVPFPRSAHDDGSVGRRSPSVSVTSVGHQTLKVDVYAADPSRWLAYQRPRATWNGDDQHSRRAGNGSRRRRSRSTAAGTSSPSRRST